MKSDDELVSAVVDEARRDAEREAALHQAIARDDVGEVARLLGVDDQAAREIVASAQSSARVTNRQILAALPDPSVPWYRRIFAVTKPLVPALSGAALLLVIVQQVGLMQGDPDEVQVQMTASFESSATAPGERSERPVRIELSASCPLDETVYLVSWPGVGPQPAKLGEVRTLKLVWDDDQKQRAFVRAFADEKVGATFVVQTSCQPTADQLVRALATQRRPWVTVRTQTFPGKKP